MKTLIFVHGTLRTGQGLHPVLERGGAKYITTTFLCYPNTILVALSKNTYPAVVQVTQRWSRGIGMPLGEVYEVDTPLLQRLDIIEGIPSFYDRFEAHVNLDAALTQYLVDHGKRTSNTIKVFYYGMHMDNRCLDNGTIIDNGDWCIPSWGMPFREWVARKEAEEADASAIGAPPGHRWAPPPRPLGNTAIEWGAPAEEEWHDEDDDIEVDENGDPI